MDYNQNLMISQTIKYIIKIEDVQTPTSKVPLRYSVSTKYNDIKNQEFSSLYAVDLLFPL